jgi:hypothetical protein
VQPAIAHGRPVADRGQPQHRGSIAPFHELPHRLRAVEYARSRGADDVEGEAVRHERVALVVHDRIEGDPATRQEGTGGSRPGAQQHDARASTPGREGNAGLPQRVAELARGEGVGGVRGDDDVEPAGEGDVVVRPELARLRNERDGALSRRGEGEEEGETEGDEGEREESAAHRWECGI